MSDYEDFEKVLKLFESNGWKLKKFWGNYRVFMKDGESLPWLIPVEDKKVSIYYVNKFKEYLQNKD